MSFIYFVLDRRTGAVKIGFSRVPDQRLRELQTAAAQKLELIGIIKGSFQLEKTIHRALEPWSLSGEWFTYAKHVQRFVEDAIVFGPGAGLGKLQNEAVRAEEKRARSSQVAAPVIKTIVIKDKLYQFLPHPDPNIRRLYRKATLLQRV